MQLSRFLPEFHPTRIPFIRKSLLGLVAALRPEVMETRYGFHLRIPKDDHSMYALFLWLSKAYERKQSDLARKLLRPGDVAIDVGANVGYYTCLFAGCVGPTGVVYSFEPEERNFRTLRGNVERNQLGNVSLHQEAVSDNGGTTDIFLSEENRGDHTLVPLGDRESQTVSTTTLDDFLQNVRSEDRIGLVKIDVQGFEVKVLRGMRKCLAERRVKNLFVEFTPHRISQAGDAPEELLEILRQSEMKAAVMNSTSGDRFQNLDTIESELRILKDDPYAAFDFWLGHEES